MLDAYNNHLLLTLVVFLVFGHSYGSKEDEESVKLDFAIVGFPKCSTTFLRNDLLSSNEEIFFGNDNNEIHYLNRNNAPALKKLFKNHPYTINGFKCPNLLYSEVGLFNLEMYFKQTDLIIAVRHPILWFQSFYNYRLRKGFEMPEPHLLIGSCPTIFEDRLNVNEAEVMVEAQKVCTDRYVATYYFIIGDSKYLFRTQKICLNILNNHNRAQFHIAISRLGKTPLNSLDEMALLQNHTLPIHNFSNKIFLMEIGQLSVENQTSADQFIMDLERFLNLRNNSLPKLKQHQPRHHIDLNFDVEKIEEREIDICDPSYDDLRKVLLNIGIDASKWIREYFLNADSVYVSQRKEFEELILQWEVDPCENDDDIESEDVV